MVTVYKTPGEFSDIIIESDGEFLTGLRFDDRKDGGISERRGIAKEQTGQIIASDDALAVFSETVRWLDIYFSGMDPGFVPKYRITGMTPFRSEVTEELLKIPYGQTALCNDMRIATRELIKAEKLMSKQAFNSAMLRNPFAIDVRSGCGRRSGMESDRPYHSMPQSHRIRRLADRVRRRPVKQSSAAET